LQICISSLISWSLVSQAGEPWAKKVGDKKRTTKAAVIRRVAAGRIFFPIMLFPFFELVKAIGVLRAESVKTSYYVLLVENVSSLLIDKVRKDVRALKDTILLVNCMLPALIYWFTW
jgi:hypothetical protein